MTRSQVRYLLGTPMVADSFNKERWDYIYYLKKGRTRHVDSRRVTVYFDGDKVAQLDKPTRRGSRGAGRLGGEDQERQDLLALTRVRVGPRPSGARGVGGACWRGRGARPSDRGERPIDFDAIARP